MAVITLVRPLRLLFVPRGRFKTNHIDVFLTIIIAIMSHQRIIMANLSNAHLPRLTKTGYSLVTAIMTANLKMKSKANYTQSQT